MTSKTTTKPRIFFGLLVLLLTSVTFILTWNYGHIQIDNLNVVNMYFSIRSYETSNKTLDEHSIVSNCADNPGSTTRETAHASPNRIPCKFPSLIERISASYPQNQEIKADDRQSVNKTSSALHVSFDRELYHYNKISNSTLSSKSLLDGNHRYIYTSVKNENLTGNKAADTFGGENHNANGDNTVNANISNAHRKPSKTLCVKRLPDCIIFGVQKCGTKALAEFLKTHPNVSFDSRQTYFFSQSYEKGLDWYRNQMACSENHQLVLERTPQYFYYKEVPERIYEMNRNIKLILIVCDPITRAISNFAMAKDRDREDFHETFENCVLGKDGYINASCKYVRKSKYQKFMNYWLNVFPLTQIHVANGGKLKDHPAAVLKDVEKFLGIPAFIKDDHFVMNKKTGFKCIRSEKSKMDCLSRKKGRKHPVVKETVVSLLNEFFRPHNTKFYLMIGQKFDWYVDE